MANEVTSDVVVKYQSTGADKVNEDLKKTQEGLDSVSRSGGNTEKATANVENRFKSLERQLGTTSANQQQYQQKLDLINRALAQNPELQDRANEAIEKLNARYLNAGEAMKGLDAQGQAAMHSVRSLIEQIALGASPVQALTGQLNHLSFAATGEGGIVGAFKQVGGFVTGLVTPLNAAIAGVTALGVAVVALGMKWDETQKEMERGLLGAARGTSLAQLNQFQQQNVGGGLSISETRNAGIEFAKTGDIVVSSLHGINQAIEGYRVLTGKDVPAATTDMVNALTSGVKGVDELNKVYMAFDATARDHVRALVDAGDQTAATNFMVDKMAETNKKAEASTSALSRAWRDLKTAMSDIATGPLQTIEQQIAAKRAELQQAESVPSFGIAGEVFVGGAEKVEQLRKELADLEKQSNDTSAATNKLSIEADNVTKSIIPQIAQIQALEAQLGKLREAEAAGLATPENAAAQQAIQNQIQALRESEAQTARYNQRVAEIAQSWGNVGQAVALQLQAMQNELPVLQAITGQEQQAAQYAADYANAIDQGRTATEAAALASAKLTASQAAATASVEKQVEALKDSTAMIRAQQNGTEATTAASIAYKNAIASGADSTAAAALQSATLANYMAKAAASANQWAVSLQDGSTYFRAFSGVLPAAGGGSDTATHPYAGFDVASGTRYTSQIDPGNVNAITALMKIANDPANIANTYVAKGDYAGAVRKIMGMGGSQQNIDQVSTLIDTMNKMTTDKTAQAGNINTELNWLQSLPQTIARDQKIADLKSSIEQLTQSTNQLNSTNQELLSPYYTQDPRVSHIGFRSQGMAQGGYVDVPGAVSANDNMIATVPVAGGERIYIDPMYSRRGLSAGANFTVNVSAPVMIAGAVDRDQLGRTMYQQNQSLMRQMRTALQ